MTDKEFRLRKWKAFEVLNIYLEPYGKYCDVYLVGIEFEDRIMKVRPLDCAQYDDDIYNIPIVNLTRGMAMNEFKQVFEVVKTKQK